MKKISLTRNQYALVDDADYEWLNRDKWYAHRDKHGFYALRNIRRNDYQQVKLSMHRLILGLVRGDGKQTDHIDGNGLNNQRANLRICSKAENLQNQQIRTGVSSQYKGVHWNKRDRRWAAHITLGRKIKYLGYFVSETQAGLAYNQAASELFGEYARLNELVKKKEKR